MKRKFSERKLPTFTQFLQSTPNPMGIYVVECVWYRSNFKGLTIETNAFRLSRRHDQDLLDLLEDFYKTNKNVFLFLAVEVSTLGQQELIFDDDVTLYDKTDIRYVDKDDWKYLLIKPSDVSKVLGEALDKLFLPKGKPGNKKPNSSSED